MVVHKVLSGVVAGFGYENGVLRVVFNGKEGLRAYDYYGVTEEDAGIFAREMGKSLAYIKGKYACKPVTDTVYFSEMG